MIEQFVFIVIAVGVSITAIIVFYKSEKSVPSFVSAFSTAIVLIAFLTYTTVYLLGYQVVGNLIAILNAGDDIPFKDVLKSKSVYEQLTYFAALASFYQLLYTNNLVYRSPRLTPERLLPKAEKEKKVLNKKIKAHEKTIKSQEIKIRSLKNKVRNLESK